MAIKVDISHLKPFNKNIETVEVSGHLVRECLKDLVAKVPAIKEVIFNEYGELSEYINVYINKEVVYTGVLTKPVKAGDELLILYMIAGG